MSIQKISGKIENHLDRHNTCEAMCFGILIAQNDYIALFDKHARSSFSSFNCIQENSDRYA